jgi:hypothetical protein
MHHVATKRTKEAIEPVHNVVEQPIKKAGQLVGLIHSHETTLGV